jgi:Rv0078B-related antitoxin
MRGDASLDSPEAQRFRHALQMADLGISMYRQRMRREHPDATDEEIEAEVQAWLMRRPGDCPGPPSSRLL